MKNKNYYKIVLSPSFLLSSSSSGVVFLFFLGVNGPKEKEDNKGPSLTPRNKKEKLQLQRRRLKRRTPRRR